MLSFKQCSFCKTTTRKNNKKNIHSPLNKMPKKTKHIHVPRRENSMDFEDDPDVPSHDTITVTDSNASSSSSRASSNSPAATRNDDDGADFNSDDEYDVDSFPSIPSSASLEGKPYSRTIIAADKETKFKIEGLSWNFKRKYALKNSSSSSGAGSTLTLIQGKMSSSVDNFSNPVPFKMISAHDGFNALGDFGSQICFRFCDAGPILNVGQNITGDQRVRAGHIYWKTISSSSETERQKSLASRICDESLAVCPNSDSELSDDAHNRRIKKHTSHASTVMNNKARQFCHASTHDYLNKSAIKRVADGASEFANVFAEKFGLSKNSKFNGEKDLFFVLDAMQRQEPIQYESEQQEKNDDWSPVLPLAIHSAVQWFDEDGVENQEIVSGFEEKAKSIK